MAAPSAAGAASSLRRAATAGATLTASSNWTAAIFSSQSSSTPESAQPRASRVHLAKRRRLSVDALDALPCRVSPVGESAASTSRETLDRPSHAPSSSSSSKDAPTSSATPAGARVSEASSLLGPRAAVNAGKQQQQQQRTLVQRSTARAVAFSHQNSFQPRSSFISLSSRSADGRPSQQQTRSFSLFRSTTPAREATTQTQTSTSTSPPPPSAKEEKKKRDPARPLGPRRLDELNTLLRHPTLYDPVLKPRHPLVLCHGLYGFDERGPSWFRLAYWSDLLKILRGTVGAEVHVTAVPGMGSIKERAHVLDETLAATQSLAGRDLNLIAHSMGGLDARYLLTKIHPTKYNPRSLVTMSTPHRGSEFMSWCRANIGIGTDFDKTSEEAARLLHEEVTAPYSLKTPLLSRAQVESARAAAEASKKARDAAKEAKALLNFLPYSLSASVTGYLLDLLDSPAYANLTPAFLNEVFNPQTPDRPDVKYYSIAARVDKIPIWHPLWLCKTVLDAAAQERAARGEGPLDPNDYGNDGLVTIESAKWGEFIGVLDNCDHWELRGSSGLSTAATAAKAVEQITQLDQVRKGWQWQDLYALVGASKSKKDTTKEKEKGADGEKIESTIKIDGDKEQGGKSVKEIEAAAKKVKAESDDASSLAQMAGWIVNHLPGVKSTAAAALKEAVDGADGGKKLSAEEEEKAKAKRHAQLMYGAPTQREKEEPFSLERFSVAVCRKLHNEGL